MLIPFIGSGAQYTSQAWQLGRTRRAPTPSQFFFRGTSGRDESVWSNNFFHMSAVSRGTKNAFRNPIRTISIVAILGLSLGLAVVMLAARSAVDNRIATVKSSIGNTVTIQPAGARGFLGGGEPLTTAQINQVKNVAHVTSVDATIDAQLRTDTDTSLKSAIDAGTLGNRGFRAFRSGGTGGSQNSAEPTNFTPPILAIGTNNPNYGGTLVGSNLKITAGTIPDVTGDANAAVLGKNLADKNSLQVGSTFTAYGKTMTVAAIYDAGNEFANNSAVFPLKTLQTLSGQTDQITSATAHVDSVDNLANATNAITAKLGSAADVTSSKEEVDGAVAPLENIRRIATISLIGTLAAGTVIILLTMVMIVRERRKEIAVLKALGAGDATIVTQFVSESFSLALLGIVVGSAFGLAFSNPILKALISSADQAGGEPVRQFGGLGGGGLRVAFSGARAVGQAVRNLQANVDWHLLLIGLGVAVGVAILGSALPAWIISKVRPAEVLRNE